MGGSNPTPQQQGDILVFLVKWGSPAHCITSCHGFEYPLSPHLPSLSSCSLFTNHWDSSWDTQHTSHRYLLYILPKSQEFSNCLLVTACLVALISAVAQETGNWLQRTLWTFITSMQCIQNCRGSEGYTFKKQRMIGLLSLPDGGERIQLQVFSSWWPHAIPRLGVKPWVDCWISQWMNVHDE